MAERRVGNRLLCADMLELMWTKSSGELCAATALLEDICEVGACLQTEARIAELTSVELRYRGVVIPAVVKYCHYRDIGYYVGVEFCENFRWSPGHFLPNHLLDLGNMGKAT